MKPILAVYQPGVKINFISEDVILELLDNYDDKDLERYSKSFEKMLESLQKYFPENFEIDYQRSRDMYNKDKMIKMVMQRLDDRVSEYLAKSKEEKEKLFHRTYGYIRKENSSEIDFATSKAVEDIFYEIDYELAPQVFSEDKIQVTLT
jgi:hypothetical protein